MMEGVVTCLLTALSLLAFLGLRYPVRMLPILLFEVAWKAIWIAAVAIPQLASDDMNAATREVLFSCSFAVIILPVIPWRYAWKRYVRTPGTRGLTKQPSFTSRLTQYRAGPVLTGS